MLHADFVFLEVFEDKANDANNFFARPEIENLSDILNDVQLKVLEHGHSILVIAKNPEAAADIVGNLSIALASRSKQLLQDFEAAVSNEDGGQLIDLEEIHKAVSVGLKGQNSIAASIKQIGQEVLSLLSFLNIILIVSTVRNQLCEGMSSKITIRSKRVSLVILLVSDQVAGERADAVAVLGGNSTLLEVSEELDARSIILNYAIDHGEGPSDNFLIVTDVLNDFHERLDRLLGLILVLALIKEVSLRIRVQIKEPLDATAVVVVHRLESGCMTKKLNKIIARELRMEKLTLSGGIVIVDVLASLRLFVSENASIHKYLISNFLATCGGSTRVSTLISLDHSLFKL